MQRIYAQTTKLNANATFHFLARLIFGVFVPDMGRMFHWFGEEVMLRIHHASYSCSYLDLFQGYPSEAIAITKEIYPDVKSFEAWAAQHLSSS